MLNSEQLAAFQQDGYLVCENVLDSETVIAPIVSEYTDLLNQLIGDWEQDGQLPAVQVGKNLDANAASAEANSASHTSSVQAPASFADAIRRVYAAGLDYFQPMDISLPPGKISEDVPFHAGPAIFNMMTNPRLLDLVESLIGSEITSNPIQHVRIKPPARELTSDEIRAHITSTAWHQDRAVTLAEADETRMVTVWAAITDATIENGCLQVIPGSHRGNMLDHCPTPQLAIPEKLFDITAAQPVPVKSGGVVIFHPLTVHGSLENTTDDIRWSFDLRYNVTGDPTGRPMFPEFVARSRRSPGSELQCSDTWKKTWLEARSRLSLTDSVEIHRWDGKSVVCA